MGLRFWDLQPPDPEVMLLCELQARLARRHAEPWQRGSIRLVIEYLRRYRNALATV